ncbi:MAG TPA: patatin-like phospholipase family protein [Thermoflexia bacterium]|nr:patatin-like phospholipase family protein [Thermoflexia bacterium]
MNKPKIGLALSGGGVRGLAHIGVLQLLEESKISIAYLAGTSMGGIIAGLYAAGISAPELRERGLHTNILELLRPAPHHYGLLGHQKIREFLIKLLGSADITFSDLQIPVTVMATDVETGELIALNNGPLIPALLATSSFPFVFGPVRHCDRWLVDGGILNNYPIDIVRQMGAERVIGVDTPPSIQLAVPGEADFPRLSLKALIDRKINLVDWKTPFLIAESSAISMMSLINQQRAELSPPDFQLSISLPGIGTFMPGKNKEIIDAGYAVARNHRAQLRAQLEQPVLAASLRRGLNFVRRLRRAWNAYHEPLYSPFPPIRELPAPPQVTPPS